MTATSIKMARHCFGRFCVDVPFGAKRGSEFKVRWISLEERILPPGDHAFELAWAEEIARADEMKAEARLEPTDTRGKIRLDQEIQPGRFRFLSYVDVLDEAGVMTVGLRRSDSVVLRLTAPIGIEFENPVRTTTIEIAQAWNLRANEGPWPAPGKDWFYLHYGAIALPFAMQERTSIHFEGGPLDGALNIHTSTVDEPQRKGMLQRFMEAVGIAGAQYAAGASVVRNRSRTVGKMKGEELFLRDSENENLHLTWTYFGEPNSETEPEIKISWQTEDVNQKEKMALWDAILDSLRPAKSL